MNDLRTSTDDQDAVGTPGTRLEDNDELCRTVVSQTSDGIFVFDAETLEVLDWNRSFLEILGYDARERPSLSLYELVGHERGSIEENARRAVEKGENHLGERTYRARDGREVTVEVTANRIRARGRTAVCVVIRDVTLRRRQEQELARSNELLRALGKISVRVASASDPNDLFQLLGEELGTIGCHGIVATPGQEGGELSLRLVCAPGVRDALHAAGCTGLCDGMTVGPAALPGLAGVLGARDAAVLHEANGRIRTALTALGIAEDRALFEALGLTERTEGALLPLAADGASIGAMLIWGDRFRPDDLAAAWVFAGLVAHILERARLTSELARQARTDPLTGLLNRRGLSEQAGRELERAARFGRPVSLLMLDVDGFKPVNDSLGHSAGDAVLTAIGLRIQTLIRGVDLAARIGGDEIAIVLPETGLEAARVLGERLRLAIASEPFVTPVRQVALSVSVGVATRLGSSEGLEALLHRADAALYDAKAAGRNTVVSRQPDFRSSGSTEASRQEGQSGLEPCLVGSRSSSSAPRTAVGEMAIEVPTAPQK